MIAAKEALERTSEAITATGDESLKHRFHPFQCDITSDRLPNWLFCCSCKERILSGQLILDAGVYHIIVSLILLIYISLLFLYIICWGKTVTFFFGDLLDKEKLKATWNKSFFPKEIGCCIGGVDYVMLVVLRTLYY